jgi:hypothetical protein
MVRNSLPPDLYFFHLVRNTLPPAVILSIYMGQIAMMGEDSKFRSGFRISGQGQDSGF